MPFAFQFVLVFLSIVIGESIITHQTLNVSERNDGGQLLSLATKVCHNTIQLSDQNFIHIVDINSHPSVPILIETLHDLSIPTVLTTHYCELMGWSEKNRMKNLIFFLDDIKEITSLILNSASWEGNNRGDRSNHEENENALLYNESISSVNRAHKAECRKINKFPRYCIAVDDYIFSIGDGKCDERILLSSAELNGSVDLSDLNFDLTRGLYTNPIWNSNNYLIFVLKEFGRGTINSTTSVHPQEWGFDFDLRNQTSADYYNALIFCFKFFWRFFRGLKTIICHEGGCSRYDPFTENIVQYNGEDNETYFDFFVTNMHRKRLKIVFKDTHGSIVSEGNNAIKTGFYAGLFDNLAALFNCTFEYYIFVLDEDGQKHNVDIIVAQIFATPDEVDLSKFDFSVGVEMESLCILTPHSKLMPQFLVPFKVFTFAVWSFILVIAAVFVLQQYVFLKAQGGLFRGMYSETEIVQYSTSSSVYMIYAYFICGSPPRLLLGKLFTGKILFFVFIFSAFIISNIFLGGMTTLLTNTVQYPEIDTLKDLADSDLFIQVPSVESAVTYFAELGLSEKLRAKLSSDVEYHINAEIEIINASLLWKTILSNREIALVSEHFAENLRVMCENDAFLVDLPHSLSSETRVVTKRWPLWDTFEYHVVEECLKTYPSIFSILKNSFLFPALNRGLAQFLETGHFQSYSARNNHNLGLLDVYDAAPPKDDEPRPYTLNDLQLPFLCLVAGLVSSFLVFSAEMMMEDFENALVFRQLKILKNYLLTVMLIRR